MSNKVFFNLDDLFISVGIDIGADFSWMSIALPNQQFVGKPYKLSLIHISEPTRQAEISYAVFCLKNKIRKKQLL